MDEKETLTPKPDGQSGESKPTEKMVPESDLLTVKAGKEGLEKKLKESEAVNKTALEDAQQKLLQSEASIEKLKEEYGNSSASTKELVDTKQQLETAQKRGEELSTKVLELRKDTIMSAFKVPAELVDGKTPEQLDILEEALKAIAANKGIGNYAAGGSGGGSDLTGMSPLALAREGYARNTK